MAGIDNAPPSDCNKHLDVLAEVGEKMENVKFEALEILLKASSKAQVIELCNEAFLYRNNVTLPLNTLQSTSSKLDVDHSQATELIGALCGLVKNALFQGSVEPKDIIGLFPTNFHKNLRDLLAKIIIEHLPQWKSKASSSLVSLPRLVDFDWRVDVKMSADSLSRMSVPTCLLQMQIEKPAKRVGSMGDDERVTLELPRETLDTMLDGLGKVRDQLSSVAAK